MIAAGGGGLELLACDDSRRWEEVDIQGTNSNSAALFDPSMEESLVPSLSSGVVGSRFVTQDEIESAKARRDEQWKAAYARLFGFMPRCESSTHYFFRLGQEPPLPQQDDSYDGRSLAEVSKVIFILTSSRIHFLLLVAMWSRNWLRIRFTFQFFASCPSLRSALDSQARGMGGEK
jgi:hypothetical protein